MRGFIPIGICMPTTLLLSSVPVHVVAARLEHLTTDY
jgi:hypothetical protein